VNLGALLLGLALCACSKSHAEADSAATSASSSTANAASSAAPFTVDPATSRVVGTLEGPLGPANIDGLAWDGKVTATIARNDPADRGFTGTLMGSIGTDHVDGTMNVALAEADAIRTAAFTLSPQASQPSAR
jgi:hypothetical protein